MDTVVHHLREQTAACYGPCDVRYDDHCMIMRIHTVRQFLIYLHKDADGILCYYIHEQDLANADHEHGEYKQWKEQQSYQMICRYARPVDFPSAAQRYLVTAVENMRHHPLSGFKRTLTFAEASWNVHNVIVPDPQTHSTDRQAKKKYKKTATCEK